MNAVKLMVSEFLKFREDTELFPSGDSYDISTGNNDPTYQINIVLVGLLIINHPGWLYIAEEY